MLACVIHDDGTTAFLLAALIGAVGGASFAFSIELVKRWSRLLRG